MIMHAYVDVYALCVYIVMVVTIQHSAMQPNGRAEPMEWLRPAGRSESTSCLPPGRLLRLVVKDRQRYSNPQKVTFYVP